MQGDSKRDQAIERLLRHPDASPDALDTAACLDAETLAAWADRTLRPAEAAIVEQHLSDCTRCQDLLATFVQTMPEEPVAESLWHRWRLPWLVPIATAATAVALWVAIPRNQPVATPAPAPAQERATSAEAKAEVTAPPKETAPTPAATDTLDKRLQATEAAPQIARADEARQDQQQLRRERALESEAPPPAAKAAEPDGRAADLQSAQRAPAGAVAGAAPAPASPPAPAAPSASGALRRSNAQQAFGTRQALVAAEIVSPDPASRWRIVAESRVERTINGGARWEPAVIPAPAVLTAGSSPAPTICWIVGRAGAVYLTTDGVRFARVPFPEMTDLLIVQATDQQRATVTSTDGRTFRTEDQGATWTN